VNGSGFIPTLMSLQGPVPGSVVQWNGTALTTTFVSTTQLTAAVPASDIASVGTALVTVGGGGGLSNGLAFSITAALTQAPNCSNASFSGTWFYTVSGTALETAGPGPYGQLMKLSPDGNGNVSGQGTGDTNGVLAPAAGAGTYTVNADCSGTITFAVAGTSNTATIAFQLVQEGREALVTFVNSPKDMGIGRAYRAAAEGASQCGNQSLAGSYGWLGAMPPSFNPQYQLGQSVLAGFVFDGMGGLSYTATTNPGGAEPGSQGTYSIAGDCSGTATFTIPGYTVNFLLAVVEGGDVLFMENDPGDYFFGIMQPDSPPSVLPQVAFGGTGGGWYTALYFTNPTNAAVSFSVNFTADDGTPLIVPGLGCLPHGCAYGSATTTVSIPALGTAIVEAPNIGSAVSEGYATFTLPPGVSGYGVFRQSVTNSPRPDQEAVVPFATANAASSTLVWDDTNFITAVAIANPGPVAATIAITVWDNNGNVVGTSTVNLPAYQKKEAALRNLPGLSGMAGLRGRARFDATSGNVAVLGLRFNGSAFTSIPAQQ
jgi:hypothetical protein